MNSTAKRPRLLNSALDGVFAFPDWHRSMMSKRHSILRSITRKFQLLEALLQANLVTSLSEARASAVTAWIS